MIPSRAIKVYASVGQPEGEYVTTVFSAHDADIMKAKLFKCSGVRSIIFTNLNGDVLARVKRNKAIVTGE
jgi:hypothetical protein